MKPIAVRNLHGQVIQKLGQRIVSGELRPGDVLPREELLAEEMDVSRSALRESMRVLSAKGLIEARPKVGTRVREQCHWQQLDSDVLAWRCAAMPTHDFVEKLVEMREIIEPAAAAAAAKRRSEDQLARIQSAYQAMSDAATLDEWSVADLKFHEAMLQATNNELMVSLFAVVESALGAYFTLSARTAGDFKYSLPQHGKVAAAIERGQAEAARRHMSRMVADSSANITGGGNRRQ